VTTAARQGVTKEARSSAMGRQYLTDSGGMSAHPDCAARPVLTSTDVVPVCPWGLPKVGWARHSHLADVSPRTTWGAGEGRQRWSVNWS
jgi:hypothetical protein